MKWPRTARHNGDHPQVLLKSRVQDLTGRGRNFHFHDIGRIERLQHPAHAARRFARLTVLYRGAHGHAADEDRHEECEEGKYAGDPFHRSLDFPARMPGLFLKTREILEGG